MKPSTKAFLGALILLTMAVMSTGCGEPNPNAPSGVTILITNTQMQGGNGPSPSPSPGESGSLPSGSTIRVGIFGQTCPAGMTVPNNGARELRLGCTAHLTATPKGADGQDLSPAVHGPSIVWSAPFGTSNVQCFAPEQPFNRDCKASTAGTFHIEATVKGLTGSLDVSVVP